MSHLLKLAISHYVGHKQKQLPANTGIPLEFNQPVYERTSSLIRRNSTRDIAFRWKLIYNIDYSAPVNRVALPLSQQHQGIMFDFIAPGIRAEICSHTATLMSMLYSVILKIKYPSQ